VSESNGDLHIGKATIVAILGLLFGIGGSVLYVGSALRQIDVNSARLTDIEQHGTGIMQTLKSQVQTQDARISEIEQHGTGILQALKIQVQSHDQQIIAINSQFRSREFWEQLERRLSALEAEQCRRAIVK